MTMTPWVTSDVVLADEAFCNLDLNDADLLARAQTACIDASSILFVLSGRTITGHRQVTVYPESTDCVGSMSPGEAYLAPQLHPNLYVTLEWPVVSVEEVKLDGEVVDPAEYQVLDYRYLRRTVDTDGNVRYWPLTTNVSGTFSITYTWGLNPPGWAVDAARELAVSLLRSRERIGQPLPNGVTNTSFQGTSYTIADRAQALRDHVATDASFPEVARFIGLVNPRGEPSATYTWSPDVGYQLHRLT